MTIQKYFVLKISETIGEYEANSKVLVKSEPENLDTLVDTLLLSSWRGDASFNEDDQVYENGEVSWYLTQSIEISDEVAEYLIKMGVLNLL